MPWKNGGGETIEIAVFPAGSSLDAFEWRISMASVASDGPFSEFANIDRTLSVLSGDGIALKIGKMTYTLTQETPPLVFAGDAPTYGILVSGPICDLNVMTRRGMFSHHVERIVFDGSMSILPAKGLVAFLPAEDINVSIGKQSHSLQSLDCLLTESLETDINLTARQRVCVYVIRIEPMKEVLPS